MNTVTRLAILFVAIVALEACGGGGGDGDDARNVSGTWRGALVKTSDNCSPASPATITVSHQVTQNEDAINLQAESGVVFLGNTVGEDGFSVDGSHSTSGSPTCSDQSRIEYDSINDDDDEAANVELTIQRTCPGSATCTIHYSGTVSRNVAQPINTPTAAAGTPTPAVGQGTPTPVPVASGGCAAINPNTEAGGFSGDGECGISHTNFSFQNNSVILEPFGSNGLTTFALDSNNSAVANSQRTDLTIKGETGNSCSMVCSPPATFSVRCIKEGGTSCLEKF